MDYCNVIKVELIGGVIAYNPIGYISSSDKAAFENFHSNTISNWARINSDLPLTDFFAGNNCCYLLNSVPTISDGLTLIPNYQIL
jgi:hypothetical protein